MNSEKDDELQKGVARFLLASYSATAILLFGMSLYFSGSGSLSFPSINFDADLTTTVATTLVISALLFKMGVAPFHSWMIDIYERSSFGLIVFFDAIWKFFIFFIFTRFFKIILDAEYFQIQIFIEVVSSLSMMIGAIMPIFQKNIKKFVAYASIGHAGFVMSVFATVRDVSSLSNAALYIISYSFASICFFTIILKLSKYRPIVTFEDLCGLMKDSPRLGYCMLASMFAMTGIPPFINFTAKLQIFTMQLSNEHHVLLAISLVFSILSVLYTGKVMINIFKPRSNSLKTPKSGIEVFLSFFAIVIAPFFYLLTDEWIKGLLRHI
jgi:NADH-quinone oxidoreductase subunit N